MLCHRTQVRVADFSGNDGLIIHHGRVLRKVAVRDAESSPLILGATDCLTLI
jgi:hypothetical protein